MNEADLWDAALGQLELTVNQDNFTAWFKETKIIEKKKGVVTIETAGPFAFEWLSKKYKNPILEALVSLDEEIKDVRFRVPTQGRGVRPIKKQMRIVAKKTKPQKAPEPAISQQRAISNRSQTLNTKYTFDSFVIGPNNEVAHAACRAVSARPGESYNPLYLYGGVGLGKTHLMHAVGNELVKQNPALHVLYVPAEKFISEFVEALKKGKAQTFKDQYRKVDVLMIDDVQFMAGKTKTQEELFHTYNTLHSQNKQIILSSDRSPKLIPTFEERLRSRLLSGMLVDIQQPSYETRLAIIQEKVSESNIKIDEASLAYIAKNIQKNVRELEGALKRVLAYCELNGQKGTLEYTQKILGSTLDKSERRTVDSSKIVETVSVYYNLTQEELCGKCRKQNIVRPRQVAMYLMRKENNVSFPSIGSQFGGRDHTTAMHACEKIDKLLEHDDELGQDIEFIKERLYA